ncbi:hypothetical protein TRFO_38839 [Tritrichomonas foetus]|uniref:Nucleoporin Nup133/Nup155-like N-terminal domain-containing protein n=1 Tax=Tritrichomonas foetus TaxID=1144522 RepID=A0A1J4J9S8_9EUKA|nr:hypothetical protein TRFO_38839 [Tritrichomonas foetus]|eukprot:OHS94975.1 hypothetical protein TRFO_38839 [Tritrichomonas foetus]
MEQKNGFSSDRNTERAIRHLNDCIVFDNLIPEFFTAIGSTDQVGYFRAQHNSDLLTMSSTTPFPQEIKPHYMCAESIGVCGILPYINRYYYILDNKLFLWRTNGINNHEQIMEQEKVITAVCTFNPARDFFTKSVNSLLAVATPTYIKIYPIENDYISVNTFYTVKVNFMPTCLCAGQLNQLFIGGSDGHLYSFQFVVPVEGYLGSFDPNSQKPQEPYVLNNLTASWIKAAIMSFLSFAVSPITKVVYDSTTGFIATLDSTQKINIYNYSDGTLSLNYSFTPPKGIQFVALREVFNSDSCHTRFIAFTSTGDRYFFGTTDSFMGKSTKIALRAERKAPAEMKGNELIDAFYTLGYYAFICKNEIIGIQSINVDPSNSYEFVTILKINGFGLAVAGLSHDLAWMDTKMFHEPFVCQHFVDPPQMYILTSDGGSSIKFVFPCMVLRQLLLQNNYKFVTDVNDYMDRFVSNDESCAMCLLLASLFPEEARQFIFIASQFSTFQIAEKEISPDILSPIVHSFYIRASRLLNLVWNSAVFYRRQDNSIKVSPAFNAMSPEFVHKLYEIIQLGKLYLEESEINSKQYDDHRLEVSEYEREQLLALQESLEEIIEALKFIKILSKQKSALLSIGIEKLNANSVARLINECFGTTDSNVFLITALREYAVALFRNTPQSPELDFLAAEINDECPMFTKSSDAQILKALTDLESASRITGDEKKQILHDSANTFIKYSLKPFDIARVCAAFIALDGDKHAVQIAAARAHAIDDAERAYYWYRNGCDINDVSGSKTFDDVYKCYEAAFDAAYSDEGLHTVLNTNDELFALLVFQRMINTNEIDRLLKLDTPLVKEFLVENAPKLLWKYYIAHHKYREAVIELIKFASDAQADNPDDEISFDKRIEYLEIAHNYARQQGLTKLVDEIKTRLNCARIQKDISHDVIGEPLKDLKDLFSLAQEKSLWSYLLRIVSIMKLDEVNKRDLDINILWYNFLFNGDGVSTTSSSQEPITEEFINRTLKNVFSLIGTSTIVSKPEHMLAIFEDFRNFHKFRIDWVVDTLTALNIDGSQMFNAYSEILNKYDTLDDVPERRNQLVYAALWLIDHGYNGDIEEIRKYINSILSNKNSPYYDEIKQIVDRINN